MAHQYILVDMGESWAEITLNRPKANALSQELLGEVRAAVEEAEADPAVRAILLTGGPGRFFAAGADLPALQHALDAPYAAGGLLEEGRRTMEAIAACTTPVIAAVNGIALGGGCELALACHLRIASDEAVFGQPEINLGLIPGWGGTHRLARAIGAARARDWLLTGRQASAREALEAGLVSRLAAPEALLDAARELARAIASKPAPAVEILQRLFQEFAAAAPEEAGALEAEAFEAAARTADAAEGVAAFLEKRAPRFTGA